MFLWQEYGSEHARMSNDLAGVWEVALSDGVHRIEFEHGTTTGKRVIFVDGKELLRRDWMFKLVGKETFNVGKSETKATINIDAVSGFAYEYTLEINGKSLKKYMENRSKVTSTWVLNLDGIDCRVVLGEPLLKKTRWMFGATDKTLRPPGSSWTTAPKRTSRSGTTTAA
ncbi:fas apoptotic inhibitory molecule a isoform X3 [Cyclopterus lumpus]|uniref:fas apoptotic inhibitory molecule a isoform X3 n=1 Tax=Cyclopterus lumpus TaxID=8103 RepID=UPI0014870602|nr:fas apoptotic inhibitory molecule a isoform X3 [Cyclopterus lumpus]